MWPGRKDLYRIHINPRPCCEPRRGFGASSWPCSEPQARVYSKARGLLETRPEVWSKPLPVLRDLGPGLYQGVRCARTPPGVWSNRDSATCRATGHQPTGPLLDFPSQFRASPDLGVVTPCPEDLVPDPGAPEGSPGGGSKHPRGTAARRLHLGGLLCTCQVRT